MRRLPNKLKSQTRASIPSLVGALILFPPAAAYGFLYSVAQRYKNGDGRACRGLKKLRPPGLN